MSVFSPGCPADRNRKCFDPTANLILSCKGGDPVSKQELFAGHGVRLLLNPRRVSKNDTTAAGDTAPSMDDVRSG
jgi:hypothetical protein